MHRLSLLLALGVACAAPQASASGQLQWETMAIEAIARAGQKIVHADFPFRNAGDKAVTLVSVDTSCRCTSADTDKKVYGPGEKGAVGVDIVLGDRDGSFEESVTVATDGPELKPFVLTVRVMIPKPTPGK